MVTDLTVSLSLFPWVTKGQTIAMHYKGNLETNFIPTRLAEVVIVVNTFFI